MTNQFPPSVVLCDVSPRDGLQNECKPIATADKIALVQGLIDAGMPRVEVTSFVSPKAIPQMADAQEVMLGLQRKPGVGAGRPGAQPERRRTGLGLPTR